MLLSPALATPQLSSPPQSLPVGWETRMDASGRVFYIDHNTRQVSPGGFADYSRTTTYKHPVSSLQSPPAVKLPLGWESKYGKSPALECTNCDQMQKEKSITSITPKKPPLMSVLCFPSARHFINLYYCTLDVYLSKRLPQPEKIAAHL
jgi:hypothetical protein